MKCLNDLSEELGTLPGLGPAVPDSIPAVSLKDIPISHPCLTLRGTPGSVSTVTDCSGYQGALPQGQGRFISSPLSSVTGEDRP